MSLPAKLFASLTLLGCACLYAERKPLLPEIPATPPPSTVGETPGDPIPVDLPSKPSRKPRKPRLGLSADEKTKRKLQVYAQLSQLEDSVGRLEAELEVFKAQTHLLGRTTTLSFNHQTYLRAAISVIFPFNQTFPSPLDSYIVGVGAGLGHYFGRNHVLEAAVTKDVGLYADFRYRYELHFDWPSITLGPILGYRRQLAATPSANYYVPNPQVIKKDFLVLGAMIGVPLRRTLVAVEVTYVTNQQALIYFNTGFHFFL